MWSFWDLESGFWTFPAGSREEVLRRFRNLRSNFQDSSVQRPKFKENYVENQLFNPLLLNLFSGLTRNKLDSTESLAKRAPTTPWQPAQVLVGSIVADKEIAPLLRPAVPHRVEIHAQKTTHLFE